MSKNRVQILKPCHNDPTVGHRGHSTNSVWLFSTCGTVKPPNKGHFGDGPVVPCREVVLFSEVFFGNFL